MTNYLVPAANTGNDAAQIQKVIDEAYNNGCSNVVIPAGEWVIDAPVYIRKEMHVHLDGAVLKHAEGYTDYIFKNSNVLLPRAFARIGREDGITITGEKGASIKDGKGIYFRNTGDFNISGIIFDNFGESGITIVYSNHGRIHDLEFNGGKNALEIFIGTRNVFVYNIKGQTVETLAAFSSASREEMVYYNGPVVANHIVRNLEAEVSGNLVSLSGEDVKDIIISDAKVCGNASEAVKIDGADGITITGVEYKTVVNPDNQCKKLFVK